MRRTYTGIVTRGCSFHVPLNELNTFNVIRIIYYARFALCEKSYENGSEILKIRTGYKTVTANGYKFKSVIYEIISKQIG